MQDTFFNNTDSFGAGYGDCMDGMCGMGQNGWGQSNMAQQMGTGIPASFQNTYIQAPPAMNMGVYYVTYPVYVGTPYDSTQSNFMPNMGMNAMAQPFMPQGNMGMGSMQGMNAGMGSVNGQYPQNMPSLGAMPAEQETASVCLPFGFGEPFPENVG